MAEQRKHPILLVDDEPEILFSLQGLLRREFQVHTAESGQDAMEILKQHPIHVIMTDQRMPEMTGVELLSIAQGSCPEAVRIVFTGYADIKAVIDAINEAHIYRYLTKPWDPDELLALLRQACAEYEQTAERVRLREDLHAFVSQAIEALGSNGAATQREKLQQMGRDLLTRLQHAPQPGSEAPETESPTAL